MIQSQVKLHRTPAGKIVRRYVFTVVVNMSMYPLPEATQEELNSITEWVAERELGKRVAHNMWRLTNQEAVTLFLLKWND